MNPATPGVIDVTRELTSAAEQLGYGGAKATLTTTLRPAGAVVNQQGGISMPFYE